VANTFREQAEERLLKSSAFMRKAETLLGDDVVYRSVLADAVSAIKNMLQGYLLLRVSQTPTSAVTARWQEIAATNRMPELIQACGEAELNLSGVAVEIKRLNNQRNLIAHDDPHTRIDRKEAARAVELAHEVRDRIKSAVQGRPVPKSLPARAARAAQVARAAVSGQLRIAPAEDDETFTGVVMAATGGANGRSAPAAEADRTEAITPATAPKAATDTLTADAPEARAATPAVASEDEDGDDAHDSDEVPAVVASPRRRSGRIRRALLRALAAAVLLIVGAAAGAGIAIPVATGHAPAWLGFASSLFAPANAAGAHPATTATATAIPTPSGATTLGALAISAPLCQGSGAVTLTLTNTGPTAITWAAGSLDGAVTLALAGTPGVAGAAAQVGTLSPGGSATLTITGGRGGGYHLVITAPAGAVELLPPSC
jgi:hypothetical protein